MARGAFAHLPESVSTFTHKSRHLHISTHVHPIARQVFIQSVVNCRTRCQADWDWIFQTIENYITAGYNPSHLSRIDPNSSSGCCPRLHLEVPLAPRDQKNNS